MTLPKRTVFMMAVFGALALFAVAARAGGEGGTIPKGAKVFLADMKGFEVDLREAIKKKDVPVQIVDDRSQAEFEISGSSDTEKASTAKKVIMLNWHSNEQASISVANLKTGDIVFAYSVSKKSSAHGKRSTAEACAKHLKEKIAGK
jgi:hypothetical protein